MTERVEKTMRDNDMLGIRSVLVGLSGGADSVALLHCMCGLSAKYGFAVFAAHINHGLRKETALRDERFSVEFAAKLGVPCFVLHADVASAAAAEKKSAELVGRETRYAFFDKIMRENNIECTATAHHLNDNAETVIMNFLRGSGIKGLRGIPYRRGAYIRPFLDVSKEDIERYCLENNLEYMTDETNLETEYTRNKIRNILIPALERDFNPSIVRTITANAAILAAEDDFMEIESEKAYKSVYDGTSVDVGRLNGLHKAAALRVLRRMISEVCGLTDVSSDAILRVFKLAKKNRTGSMTDIAKGCAAKISYGRLVIYKKDDNGEEDGANKGFCVPLAFGMPTYIPEIDLTVLAEYAERQKKDGAKYFSVPENCRLAVRSRRSGDRFYPNGMTGAKKLKSYMTDEKIPRDKRGSIALLTCSADDAEKIMWVIGYRLDGRFMPDKSGRLIRVTATVGRGNGGKLL